MIHSPARVMFLRRGALLLLVLALAAGALLSGSQAQTSYVYFPQTGHYLGGAFRTFWESNGGLANFGYPITPEYVAGNTGRVTQYFERARFELTEQNGQAVIELGKLGVEFTGGRIFPKVPPIENTPDRRYFPQTQHIVQYGFKEIWETRGGERIFGLPISEEIKEIIDNGEWHTVQYFEQARFEYWPQFPPGQRVLISALGRRLAPAELTAPRPPNQPPGAPAPGGPAPAQPAIPPSVNARVTPESGPPGTTFRFEAQGFNPGEPVGIWLTAPDQSTVGADFQAQADSQGSIAHEQIGITTDQSFGDGIWSFNAQGVNSGKQAVGYFRISRAESNLPPGNPNRLGVILHDQLPTRGNAFILPLAAPAGTSFIFLAGGYTAGEQVGSWITDANGQSRAIDPAAVEVSADGTVQVVVATTGLPDGVYTAVAQGVGSGVVNAAAFKLTSDYVAGPGTPRPANVNGSVTPAEGGQGTTFRVRGQNLRPNEDLEFWITEPSGAYTLLPLPIAADGQGRVGYDPALDITATEEILAGVYGFHFRGRASGARVDVYFTITGNTRAAPGAGLRLFRQLSGRGALPALPFGVR